MELDGKNAVKTIIMDDNGRVTISKKFRERYSINPGDKLEISDYDGIILISKDSAKPKTLSFEYLYNRVITLEKERLSLEQRFEELRRLVINDITGD